MDVCLHYIWKHTHTHTPASDPDAAKLKPDSVFLLLVPNLWQLFYQLFALLFCSF